ncbi:MAG: hypothetical protein J5845_07395 [Lachnospiraceae bacterium]|nr:hypothetical protein [Lachnospiraceae bacterium]
MKEGDYDSAVEIAEKIRPEKVGSVRDLTSIANAFLKKQRYEDAKDIYIEMHNHAQTHKVLVGLIELCLKTNSPEEAEIYIREFRKQEPDNPERLIYRYRVDVMLGKGPEYLVKSLSKLKDEDYSETWGLELAKAYYKMEEYSKCAQECKDILLWFAGSEAASKAQVLLNACGEKGVKISMPAPKVKKAEPVPEKAEEVPVEEPLAEEEPSKQEDEGFFDLSAAIGEVVSETIAEDAKAEEATEDPDAQFKPSAAEAAEVKEDAYDEADLEAVEEIKFNFSDIEEEAAETADEAVSSTAEVVETYADEIEDKAEAAEEAADDFAAELAESIKAAVVDESEEAVPGEDIIAGSQESEDDTFFEEGTFFEEDEAEKVSEVPAAQAEETVEAAAEAVEEIAEEIPEDVTVDIDIIALAVKKAKEADDDDDDIVLTDYYSEEELKEAEWEKAVKAAEQKSRNSAVNTEKSFYIPPLKYNTPESILSGSEKTSGSAGSFDGIPTISVPGAKSEPAGTVYDRVPGPAESVVKKAEKAPVKSEEDFLKDVSASVDNILSVDAEEEDGQMSFFSKFDADDSVTLSGSRKDDETDDFADIAGSIADSVKEEIENGEKEPEVSAAPTKRFAEDFTAQALDAALRDDDEAIERALYGLLSEK